MVPALLLCLLAACATMEPPRGGPEDKTPPTILDYSPDSAAVGLRGVRELEIVYSEKVEPLQGERVVRLFPPLEIKSAHWKGRRRLRIELVDTLPADTVIVVEIPAGHPDMHRVASRRAYRFPIATADSLPPGRLDLSLVMGDSAVAGTVVELYAVPPETLEWFRQDPLRRAAGDTLGRASLEWLPVPGGPWMVRAFVDANGDGRPAENEPQRLLPVEALLTPDAPRSDLGVFTLYGPREPGRLTGPAPAPDPWTGAVFAWAGAIAEEDTGFAPAQPGRLPEQLATAAPGETLVVDPAGPGAVRAILFVDLDGDSLLSALPDSSSADTVLWRWEPYALLEPLEVEPGLPLAVEFPGFADTLAPCLTPPPQPVARDTAAVAEPDSLGATVPAPGDTLAGAAADSLAVPAPTDSLATGTETP